LVFQQDCGYRLTMGIFDWIKTLIVEERCPLFLQMLGMEHLRVPM